MLNLAKFRKKGDNLTLEISSHFIETLSENAIVGVFWVGELQGNLSWVSVLLCVGSMINLRQSSVHCYKLMAPFI